MKNEETTLTQTPLAPEVSPETPEKQPRKQLVGLKYRMRSSGAVVEDHRRGKPRFVGLIMPRHTGPGYTFCPFVREKLVFDTNIPESIRSAQKAAVWMTEHAIGWKDKYDYNHLKYLGWLILFVRRWQHILRDQRMQISISHLLLSILIPLVCIPAIPHIATYIASTVLSLLLFVPAVMRIAKVIKDNYYYKEKH